MNDSAKQNTGLRSSKGVYKLACDLYEWLSRKGGGEGGLLNATGMVKSVYRGKDDDEYAERSLFSILWRLLLHASEK